MPAEKKRIFIALNTTWNIANFRGGLISALIDAGYEVIAAAPHDAYVPQVQALGCRYVPLPMHGQSKNPVHDFALLVRFLLLFLRFKPHVYLGYTIKPNVYGSLAAHVLGIPTINNIAGLGATFIHTNWLTRVVKQLYKWALSKSALIFFQNADDQQFFVEASLANHDLTDLLPGSGIDLAKFEATPYPAHDTPTRFLLIGRMLWEKGVQEYVDAARHVRANHADAEFLLLGFIDANNPYAVSLAQITSWEKEGIVRYLGETSDVRPFITSAHCIVLPSYREGVPRTLLEAAAMQRPIIATRAPGCRDVVDDGVNGYLCEVRNADDLADKLKRFMRLTHAEQADMGVRGRDKIASQFDEHIVVSKYLAAIERLIKS